MNPPDFISLWRQCDELGFVPPVVTIGRACCFIDTIEALGDIAVGVTAELWVHPGCPFRSSLTGQTVAEFAEAFEQEFNKYWRVTAMEVLQLFEITVDALKRAAS
ncbi:MAG: ABC transporter substrate-binding protein, partial [Candidatus Bathyarchaeia archaeon]